MHSYWKDRTPDSLRSQGLLDSTPVGVQGLPRLSYRGPAAAKRRSSGSPQRPAGAGRADLAGYGRFKAEPGAQGHLRIALGVGDQQRSVLRQHSGPLKATDKEVEEAAFRFLGSPQGPNICSP